MKIMKINIIKAMIPAAALLLAASVTSCMGDLDKGNIDPNAQATVNITGLYSKCYAGLIMEGNDGTADFKIDDNGKSTLLRNIFNFNELSTDEAICWWSDGGIIDICYNRCEPGTATLRFLYYRLVNNIAFCNQYISLDEAQEDKTKLAEVRVIRAFNYFQMLDFFGDPSFTTTISAEMPKQAHAYNEKFDESKTYTRAELLALGREFLFNWVKSEIETAETDLLDAQPKDDSDVNYGRIDKASAWFLLSRLYLNAGTYLNNDGQNNAYWEKALEYSEKVINSGYSLFDDSKISAIAKSNGYRPYDLLFMGDNGSNGSSCEAILPLKQDGKITKGWGGSLFFVAAKWDDKMHNVIGLGAGTTANNWSGMRCRPQFLEKFTNNPKSLEGKSTADIRALNIDDRALFWGIDHSLDLGDNSKFQQGIATTKWNNNYSNGGTPHDAYDVDIDFFLFRVAEAYLNAAEAALHLNNASKAKTYIDAIRNRAHTVTSSSYSLDDVLDERARELYFEGVRRTDLIRYNQYGGMQASYNWDYKGGFENGGQFEKTRNVYPLPSSEILANSNLIQIDGYGENE
jgi:hypothetical protein